MPSYVNTPPSLRRYAIAKADTGEYLGLKVLSAPTASAEFDNNIHPLSFSERSWAITVWRKWLTENGYIRRNVTLPKAPVSYEVLRPVPRAYLVTIDMHPALLHDFGEDPDHFGGGH